MKNKLFKLFVGAAALSVSLVASANEKVNTSYVSVKGGASFATKAKFDKGDHTQTSKVGPIGSLALGHYFDAWRVELEANYEQHKCKDNRVWGTTGVTRDNVDLVDNWSKFTAMANVYYDWEVADSFSIYVGAGLGLANVNVKTKNATTLDPEAHARSGNYAFAYQLMAGVSYDITDAVALTLGYRFSGTTKVKLNDSTKFKTPFSNSVELGLRYSF